MNKKKWIGIGVVAYMLLIMIGCWLWMPVLSVRFVHQYFVLLLIGLLIMGVGFSNYTKPIYKNIANAGIVISTMGITIIVVSYIISFSAFNWETKRDMLQVEESLFNESVSNMIWAT